MTKKTSFFRKSKLDEMQELKLLKIESHGYWIGFWGLLLAMMVQVVLTDPTGDFRPLTGEFIVFMCMAVYMVIACIRNGVWDRHIPATPKANIGVSLLSATVFALFFALLNYKNYQNATVAAYVFVIQFVMLGVGLSVALTLTSALYRRKRRKLDGEKDD